MRLISIALLFAVLLFPAAHADENQAALSVTGHGVVSAPPDVATIMTGVESFADSASEALAVNSDQMQRVFKALDAAGIEQIDIQTSNLSVSPRYNDRKISSGYQVAGYQVRNTLTVRVRDVSALGEILDTIVSTGANRIDAVSFGFSDPKTLRDQARKLAVEDARNTAELYASAAGVSLGAVLSISDGSSPVRPMQGMAMAEMSRSAVPIAAGQSSVSDTVRIVWALSTRN